MFAGNTKNVCLLLSKSKGFRYSAEEQHICVRIKVIFDSTIYSSVFKMWIRLLTFHIKRNFTRQQLWSIDTGSLPSNPSRFLNLRLTACQLAQAHVCTGCDRHLPNICSKLQKKNLFVLSEERELHDSLAAKLLLPNRSKHKA